VRIFLAGASGVIGVRLVPLFVAAGHAVAGMTRSPAKAQAIRRLGAEPLVCDVFDADALRDAVTAFRPDLVMHQLTDLPDDVAELSAHMAANARIRREGTRNLLAGAAAAGAARFLAQSIAFPLPGDAGAAVAEHERLVLDAGGIVVQYGQFYGPGTFYETDPPPPPAIQIDDAARRTVPLLERPGGVVVIAEPEPTGSG
jgi:nucleoside-diphosphate-sugar epimerase